MKKLSLSHWAVVYPKLKFGRNSPFPNCLSIFLAPSTSFLLATRFAFQFPPGRIFLSGSAFRGRGRGSNHFSKKRLRRGKKLDIAEAILQRNLKRGDASALLAILEESNHKIFSTLLIQGLAVFVQFPFSSSLLCVFPPHPFCYFDHVTFCFVRFIIHLSPNLHCAEVLY